MSVESASPAVYFPQTCSHISHSVNARGELRTALITGGNRLVLLKDGECVAECTIVLHTTSSTITISSNEEACVRCMTICPCADDVIRVAVATQAGLQLVEMTDTDWAGAHSTEGQHEDTTISNKVDNASPASTSSRTTFTANTRSTLHASTTTYKASVPSTSNVAHWSTMHGSALQRSQQQNSSYTINGRNDTQARELEERQSGVCHRFVELTSAPPRSPLQDNTTTITSNADKIVTMAFMTQDTLCIVWPNEAILVSLRHTNTGNESDVVLWRSVGQYICLSICPFHHHVALATSGRQIRVFTSYAGNNKNSNACGALGECTATPSEENSSAATIGSPVVFSTASNTDPLSALSLARADTKSAQGTSESVTSNNNRDTSNEIPLPRRTALTASTGLYDIVKMEWQRVASHSLLCVTCRSGRADLEGCVLLYAVQRISTVAPFSNVVVHTDLNEAYGVTPEQHHTTTNMERSTTTGSTMQLIPCGIIPLHYGLPEMAHHVMHRSRSVAESVSAHGGDAWNGAALPSVAQMHTALVPSFTTSTNSNSDGCVTRGQTLQFLHVEGDGTVRTSSYQIGSRKHASFAKQRALGMVCVKLLAPLWQLYGPLTEMELLPVWLSRPVEVDTSTTSNGRVVVNESDLGITGNCTTTNTNTTTTHTLASSRRYRLVGHFADGVRALVMVDLVAEVFRVEAFFTLGPRRVRSLCAVHSSSSSDSVQSFASSHQKSVRIFDDGTLETLRLTGTRLVAALLAPCQVTVTSQPAAASASAAAASNTSYEVCERERSQSSYSAAYSSGNPAGWSCCNNNSAMQTATLASARAMAVALFSEHYNASSHARRTQLLAIVPLVFAELNVDDTTTTTHDASNITPEETAHLSRETDLDYSIVDACVTREGIVLRLGKGSIRCNNSAGRSTAANASVNEAYAVVRLSCVRLDSLGALEGRLVVGGVCVPALLQAELLPTNTDLSTPHSRYEETYCDVSHDTNGQVVITVHSPLLPDDGASLSLAEYCPAATDTLLKCVHEVQCVLCVNQDVCIGVLVEFTQSNSKSTSIRELWLFSYGVVQSMSSSTLRFVREHVITAVHSFCLGPRGEVMSITEDKSSEGSVCLTRWLRCFPTPNEEEEDESTSISIDGRRHTRYACYYIQERSWQGLLRTSDETKREEGEHTPSVFMTSLLMLPCKSTATIRGPTSSLLYASSACDYLRVQHVPFQLASHTPLTNNARRESNDGKKVHEDGCTMQEQALLTYWQSLWLHHAPVQATALAEQDACAGPATSTAAVIIQYHTDVVMQLIGMGQWSVLQSLLQHVADAARALLDEVKDKGIPYHVRARRFVHTLCSASSHAVTTTNSDVMQPAFGVEDYATRLLAPSPIALHAWPDIKDQAAATHEACTINTGAGMAEVFGHNGELLQELLRLLPHVTLVGLSRPQQLGLLCVLEALRQAADFARSVDEAAARYLLYHRLRALRRRLQLPDYRDITTTTTAVNPSLVNTLKTKERMSAVLSVMNFAEGDVASRTTSTAHYLWAALSDSQSALLERLFNTSVDESHGLTSVTSSTTPVTTTLSLSSTSTLTWAQVEMSGAPYWVHSTQELRTLAERVARTQYATSHSITEAALMFVLARRVSTLAALCKAQNNTKLQSFFLRNFASEEHHRRAATANAFAAVGKNMPLYAAAFFVLAGEVRSAAQVVLQRYGSPTLALFVLRAGREAAPYGPEGVHTTDSATRLRAEDLEWFVTQWQTNMNEGDESNKAPSEETPMTSPSHALTLWLRACMAWLSGQADRRVHALSQLAAHPTGLPEILGTLRYARDSVITVAHRHGEFLSCARELICVMRLGRFCLARGLYMNAELHYAEAELLLQRLQEQHTSINTASKQSGNGTVRQAKGGTHAHMQADVATGTLVFHSFDSDSEEAEVEAEDSEDEDAKSTDKGTPVSNADDAVPAQSVVAALRREMAHARRRIERHDAMLQSLITPTQLDWSDTSMAALDAGIFAFCSALLLSLDRQDDLRGWLAGLVTHLQPAMDALQWYEPTTATETTEEYPIQQEEQDNELCETHRLFVLVLQLVLGTMASRRRHYQLASALLRLQSLSVAQLMQRVEPVLGTDKAKACMHPVVAFFVALQYYMETCTPCSPAVENSASARRSRHSDPTAASAAVLPGSPRSAHAMLLSAFGKPPGLDDSDEDDEKEESVSHAQEEQAGDNDQHRSLWETLRATTEAETRRAAQERGAIGQPTQSLSSTAAAAANCRLCLDTDAAIAMLFTWFSLRVNWTVLCALYAMATTMVALPEHHETHNTDCFDSVCGMPARLLLCQALLRVHGDFAWCTEWAMSQYAEGLTQCEACLTCDPNGLFLEADRVCRAVRASLEATLATCAKEVKDAVWQGGRKGTSDTMDSAFFSTTGHSAAAHTESSNYEDDDSASPSRLLLELCIAHVDLYGQPSRQSQGITTSGTPHVLLLLRPRLLREGILRGIGTKGNTSAEFLKQLIEWHDIDDNADDNERPHSPVSDGASQHAQLATMRRVMSEAALGGSSGSSVLLRSTEKLLLGRDEHNNSIPTGIKSDPLMIDTAGNASHLLYSNELLCVLERTWLRRHHTHLSLRCILLRLGLRGGLRAGPLPADRMLLHQSGHAVRSVGFDHSSGDSVVWSGEAGTMVSHGFREMLAGDHEQALQRLAPERNIATAVFSQGLAQQQQSQSYDTTTTTTTTARAQITPHNMSDGSSLQRPRMALAISARPAPHPHLPFFLTSQRDGRVDLYPFASTECMASYVCPGLVAPVTTAAYSLDGYSFCVGLHDGSIAGWEFSAANFENSTRFHFTGLFVPAGLRVVMYCGDRSSIIVAIGLISEPHDAAHDAYTTATTTSAPVTNTTTTTYEQSVPELLVIDTVLQPGAVLVRCALPFLPDYAAYMPFLDAVLCISAEGFIACYEVRRGQLTILGDVALDEVLASVVDEGTIVGSPTTNTSGINNGGAIASSLQSGGVVRATPGRVSLKLQAADNERMSGRTTSSSSPSPHRHHHHRRHSSEAAVLLTSLAVSAYDPLIALGTSHGHALLLTMEQLVQSIASRKSWAVTMGEESYEYHVMLASNHYDKSDTSKSSKAARADKMGISVSQTAAAASAFAAARQNYSIFYQAAQVQIAPLVTKYAAIEDVAFSPSVLLAGLRDGKVMAVSLISQALRQLVTR